VAASKTLRITFLLLLVQHRHAAPPAVNLIADRDEAEIPQIPAVITREF
jgi:hypothetical protein